MSNVSGKFDFKDSLWMKAETEEEAFNKFNGTKLYMIQPLPEDFSWENAQEEKIDIPETYYKRIEYSSIKDLIPFYPHIIALSVGSTVCLSSESYVDREERNSLEFMLKEVLRIYNRCKRKKIEFDVDEAVDEVSWLGWNYEVYREITERVKLHGKKATVGGIHLRMHEIYRRELAEDMIKNGLNPADYGLERFVWKGKTNE